MAKVSLTGSRIRDRRLALDVKQADLAEAADISASYLNLIEHNKRRIGGKLLVRIAAALDVTPVALSEGPDAVLTQHLEALTRQSRDVEVDRIDEFVGRFPGWAKLLAEQKERIETLEEKLHGLNDRLTHDPVLTQSMHDVLGAAAAIRSTASILMQTPDINAEWRARFHTNIDTESRRLAETSAAMAAHFDQLSRDTTGFSTPVEAVSAFLEAQGFHVPELEAGQAVDAVLDGQKEASAPGARVLAAKILACYSEDARSLPLDQFAQAAAACDFDPAKLAAVFSTDLPKVFRRLASLPRDPSRPEIGFASCDVAGGILLTKRPLGFAFRRSGDACHLWPLFLALRNPGMPIRETLISPEGARFAAYSIAQPIGEPGFNVSPIVNASMILIADPDGTRSQKPVAAYCPICGEGGCDAWRPASSLQIAS